MKPKHLENEADIFLVNPTGAVCDKYKSHL